MVKKSKKHSGYWIWTIILLTAFLVSGFFSLDEIFPSSSNGKSEITQETSNVYVHFVNVGQGDCAIIQNENSAIIIDAGENSESDKVLNYALKLGIKKFDYLIATHPHSDHIGGLDDVINKFDIGTVIMPKLPDSMVPTTSAYENLLTAISDKGLKIKAAVPGMSFDIDGAELTILAPTSEYDNLNDFSVVCRMVFGERSFIFCGDISKDAERDLIKSGCELKSDVLKVAHHGSGSSSCKEFITAVAPQYAVISVGAGNDYGHPTKAALDRLKSATVLRTDVDGNIVIKTDGNDITAVTGDNK